jgi:hypothetical protein
MNSCDNTGLMLYSLFLFNVFNYAFHLKIVLILYNFLNQVNSPSTFSMNLEILGHECNFLRYALFYAII